MQHADLGPLCVSRIALGTMLIAPAGSRLGEAGHDLEEAPARRAIERTFRAVDEARAIARDLGATVPRLAIAWLLAQPGVTAPIIGPRTPEQLDDLLGAADTELTQEQVDRLSATTQPPERYPDRMLSEQAGIDVERQARRGTREPVQ